MVDGVITIRLLSKTPYMILGALAILMLIAAGYQRSDYGEPGRIVVMAASSLEESLTELRQRFEQTHPGADIQISFAGTQRLRTQLELGLPADVFISADVRHIEALRSQGMIRAPRKIASTSLVLVVPAENLSGIKEVRDLSKPHRFVQAALEVPLGAYTQEVLQKLDAGFGEGYYQKVQANLVSEETSARGVLAKTALGEADAGFVYHTDVYGGRAGLKAIEIPDAANVNAQYFVSLVKGSRDSELAREFTAYLLSPEGRKVFQDYGFN